MRKASVTQMIVSMPWARQYSNSAAPRMAIIRWRCRAATRVVAMKKRVSS